MSLHLLQLAFADRKRLASGQVMYEVRRACVWKDETSTKFSRSEYPLSWQG